MPLSIFGDTKVPGGDEGEDRLLVGNDDKIVNNENQLMAANQSPSVQWLKQHDVTAVYAVHIALVPDLIVHKLP